jgi:DNA-binding NarL/FixJ family response regulator
MRILVVEDHPLMAEALALALHGLERPALRTVQDVDAAFRVLAESPMDLVLLDLGLPGCCGIEALERLRGRFAELPVLVISGASDPALIQATLHAGAVGFITKSCTKEVILGAVRLVASGGTYVPVEALGLGSNRERAAVEQWGDGGLCVEQLGLSPRRAEVLTLLLDGLPNKEIARRLEISENTTKAHVGAVLKSLGVTTRVQAMIAASRLGLRLTH